jgi:hypothetical protein
MGLLTDIYDRYQTNKRAEQLGGLLTQYQGQPITMGIQHPDQPSQGPGGLLDQNQQLPAQFYNRAMTIPGYEQFGLNQQQNAASMAEQQQEQDWKQNNMTMAQTTTAEQNLAQLQQRQAQFEAQQAAIQQRFESLSPYEKAVLEAQQQAAPAPEVPAFVAAGGKVGQGQQLTPDGTGLMNAPGGKQDQEARQKLADLYASEEYYDALDRVLDEEGPQSSSAAAAAVDAMITGYLGPANSVLANTGAQNAADIENVKNEFAWELNAPFSNTLHALLPGDQKTQAKARSAAARKRFRDKAAAIAKAAGLPAPTYPNEYIQQTSQERLAELDKLQNR